MAANLQRIRAKLGRREPLSGSDLRSLDPLHESPLCSAGDRSRESSSGSRFLLDYLDRSLLDGRVGSEALRDNGPRLVRYVGMVQDMLDPEYYEACDSQGRSAHFGDFYEVGHSNNTGGDEEDPAWSSGFHSGGGSLAVRIPLVVVPIPFASEWLRRGVIGEQKCGHDHQMQMQMQMPRGGTPTVVSPMPSHRGDRKRDRAGDHDHCENGTNAESSRSRPADARAKREQEIRTASTTITSPNRGASESTTDWWPAGTCGTTEDQCPVLAKICYDQLESARPNRSCSRATATEEDAATNREQQQQQQQHQHQQHQHQHQQHQHRPLMLNDVVSMVGVLSIHPFDADFSGQKHSDNGFDLDDFAYASTPVPPPSRLPRLHVLSYRRLELDDLARTAIRRLKPNRGVVDGTLTGDLRGECDAEMHPDGYNNSNSDSDSDNNSDSDSDEDSEVEWSGFPGEEPLSSSSSPSSSSSIIPPALVSLLQDGPWRSTASEPSWIRALWMCLLSGADRKRPDREEGLAPEIIRAGPSDRALGCVSLRLTTPDGASAKALYEKLTDTILPGLCPVVAAVDLGDWKTTLGPNPTSFFPRKDETGRLNPCPLQLPKGSVVVIHCPPSCAPRNNDAHRPGVRKDGARTNVEEETILAGIHELVQHHRIPYRFEGGVKIPFDADYRIILVTTQTQEFPCTLSAVTGGGSSAMMTDDPSPPLPPVPATQSTTTPELREILINGRSTIGNHVQLSPALLEQAQKDFLDRRRRCHESLSASSPLPGEDDFHRWLTLTKLETRHRRSRGTNTTGMEPSVKDWELALKLDDEIRNVV